MNWADYYIRTVDKLKNRKTPIKGYYEVHHIIPRSMGGEGTPDNLLKVTIREHLHLHMVLVKMDVVEYPNAIFSVVAILEDRNNLKRIAHRRIHGYRRWILKRKTLAGAKLLINFKSKHRAGHIARTMGIKC